MWRWSDRGTRSTTSSSPTCRQAGPASAATASTISSTCTSARARPSPPRNRSSSSCRGVPTPPRLRRRCCTLGKVYLLNSPDFGTDFFVCDSSSFDALKKSLVGVQKYIQATDLSEASQEAVEEKLRATDRQ